MDPAALLTVDDCFATHAQQHRLPGVAYGVVADGVLVHARGIGKLDLAQRGTPDVDTSFRIASMTKSFTAAAVLALRDDGALALDDPIVRHVPQLTSLRRPTTDSPAVTVRHLLTMASGLATDDPWADRLLDADDDTMNALFERGATFASAPGTAMVYSNYGYAMLGRAIDNVTGRRFQDFIIDRLLKPLGMHHTNWTAPNGCVHAVPYRHLADGWREEIDPLGDGGFASMGGLWSTVGDLARWVAWFADAFPARDTPDDSAMLRRSSRREMQQSWRADEVTTTDINGGARVTARGYGFGLSVMQDSRLGPMVAHSGGLPGFGSNMRWLPERRIGVIALANVTYAQMASATLAALDALHDAHALVAVPPIEAQLLERTARELVALLNDWTNQAANALFAFNVLLDDDIPTRRARVAEHGQLTIETVKALNATEADVQVRSADGRQHTLEFSLSAEVPPRLQWYELTPTISSDAAPERTRETPGPPQ